jgi:trk system potassium uptake protein TrkA
MRKKTFFIFEGKNLAYALAKKLLLLGNEVYYISKDYSNLEVLDGLKAYHSSFELIHQDATESSWVQNLDINKQVGALIVLSEEDSLNFVVCWLLRQFFTKVRILSLVNNTENEFMFEELDVDILTPTSWMEKLIESSINYENITDFFNPYMDKISIFEVQIEEKDSSCNKILKDIALPKDSIIGIIVKYDDSITVPHGDTIIEKDDKLIIFAKKEDVQKIKEILK